MSRIQLLPSHVANQIAAGEVVERPASVVKELVENSLDAGATEIQIDINKGGIQLIRIKDNGRGIHVDDLPLALARHATSKIKTEEDLSSITSLGFRGEALASISSIARVLMSSKQRGETKAWCIQSQYDQTAEVKPVAHPEGTTVEVRDLFFNVPARRKFLKTENTEFHHIQDVIERMALVHPAIAFTLTHNQRVIYDFPAATTEALQQQRIAKICGNEFAENVIEIEAHASGLKLAGWIGLPVIARNQTDLQFFYVNQRPIKDRLVNSAVKKAYQDVLYQNRFPCFILFLEIDPEAVDVNAHPAKHEVRFRESRFVYDFIFSQLRRALHETRPAPDHHPIAASRWVPEETASSVWQIHENSQPMYATQTEEQLVTTIQTEIPLPAAFEKVSFGTPSFSDRHCEPHSGEAIQKNSAVIPPLGYAIGQLQNIYILAENTQGLVIIDMHAAHERVLYERLKKSWDSQGMTSQALLLPISLQVTEKEMQCVQTHQTFLASLALEVESAAPQVLIVRAVPAQLIETNIVQLVRDLISDLMQDQRSDQIQEKTHTFLASMACRAAVHAHHKLNITQMNALLREMEQTDLSGQCNHGRPTYRQFSLNELDKLFLRGK